MRRQFFRLPLLPALSRLPAKKQRAGPGPDPLEIVSLTPLPHILESARGY